MSVTKQSLKKSVQLSVEFDHYLATHPEAYVKIPKGAVIIITSSDPKFRKESLEYIHQYPKDQAIIEARKTDSRWLLRPLEPNYA